MAMSSAAQGMEDGDPAAFSPAEVAVAVSRVREPLRVIRDERGRVGVVRAKAPLDRRWTSMAELPPVYPEWLGDRSFCEVHRLRFPYVGGEMANGIATTHMVIALAKAGMLGFFGAAGLSYERVERAVDELQQALGNAHSWGINLIHSPQEPALEERVADLLLRKGVHRVSASAFMALTPAVVRYSASGLTRGANGQIERKNFVFAKLSRPEVARRFLAPAPEEMLQSLVARGLLTAEEAMLARRVPVAEDISVEADSGGHTDNQTLTALFPIVLSMRDSIAQEHGYNRPIRVGAAGGLGTPSGVAAAFALGAAYVLTGSVNQSCVEAGLSEAGKVMLAQADLADVIMAPAADMFELGVKVQVLKRGTMFGVRGLKLYEIYQAYPSWTAIPEEIRARVEKEILRLPFEEVWKDTERFWRHREPAEADRAVSDPKHQMALCFRWYLGKASRWAIEGTPDRRMDYQIWCGPAMGAFNAWAKGSFLEEPRNRTVVQVARNLLEGAAVVTRAQQLRTFGAPVPTSAFQYPPRPLG